MVILILRTDTPYLFICIDFITFHLKITSALEIHHVSRGATHMKRTQRTLKLRITIDDDDDSDKLLPYVGFEPPTLGSVVTG